MDRKKVLEMALDKAVSTLVDMVSKGASLSSIEAQKALVEDTRRRFLKAILED